MFPGKLQSDDSLQMGREIHSFSIFFRLKGKCWTRGWNRRNWLGHPLFSKAGNGEYKGRYKTKGHGFEKVSSTSYREAAFT